MILRGNEGKMTFYNDAKCYLPCYPDYQDTHKYGLWDPSGLRRGESESAKHKKVVDKGVCARNHARGRLGRRRGPNEGAWTCSPWLAGVSVVVLAC